MEIGENQENNLIEKYHRLYRVISKMRFEETVEGSNQITQYEDEFGLYLLSVHSLGISLKPLIESSDKAGYIALGEEDVQRIVSLIKLEVGDDVIVTELYKMVTGECKRAVAYLKTESQEYMFWTLPSKFEELTNFKLVVTPRNLNNIPEILGVLSDTHLVQLKSHFAKDPRHPWYNLVLDYHDRGYRVGAYITNAIFNDILKRGFNCRYDNPGMELIVVSNIIDNNIEHGVMSEDQVIPTMELETVEEEYQYYKDVYNKPDIVLHPYSTVEDIKNIIPTFEQLVQKALTEENPNDIEQIKMGISVKDNSVVEYHLTQQKIEELFGKTFIVVSFNNVSASIQSPLEFKLIESITKYVYKPDSLEL